MFGYFVLLAGLFTVSRGAAPVCTPSSFSVTTGINITTPVTLATFSCTDSDGDALTYTVDSTSDGHTYFEFSGNAFRLVNRLDVEYGQVTWPVRTLVVDNSVTPQTATVTITITTYHSTSTTTTTPAPPGYNWFKKTENVILFGSTVAFAAFTTGFCILMCWRFKRVGTCLPKTCPEFRQCTASVRRQCMCCPIPCDFYKPKEVKPLIPPMEPRIASPLPPPLPASVMFQLPPPEHKKEPSPPRSQSPTDERANIVSPVIVGNVQLSDVGLDGMRSPGFNAPTYTLYGGKDRNVHRAGKQRRH